MGQTQVKGDYAVVRIIENLMKQGFNVSLPISESLKYDLVTEKDGKCKTVQCRHTKIYKGSLPVKLRSIWTNGKGHQSKRRKKEDYDILAIFCPDTDEVYYLKNTDFSSKSNVNLRIEKPSKFANGRCRLASDYKILSINGV